MARPDRMPGRFVIKTLQDLSVLIKGVQHTLRMLQQTTKKEKGNQKRERLSH
jgi:hypothetical protein